MYKLRATILKDVRVLRRDKIGLIFMFVMPVLLVLIVTSMQSSTFELANKNKVPLLLCNKDTGAASRQFIRAIDTLGLFMVKEIPAGQGEAAIRDRLHNKEALLAVVLPADFSAQIAVRTKSLADKTLNSFGLGDSLTGGGGKTGGRGKDGGPVSGGSMPVSDGSVPLTLYYHPVLQESFRRSAEGAIYSALQLVESKQLLKRLYFSINEKELPDTLENELLSNRTTISEIVVSMDGSRGAPNVSQHNVPAWTIFAMFFVVVSLGSGIVREKLNGSSIRLKTLPTNYFVAILSKQVTYLGVTMAQALLIFAIGVWIFPVMGLPRLTLPGDWAGLVLVSLLCGCCAVSYAICVGVFAETEEQANGFGALSIVILAAIGGLMVPDFIMTGAFRTAMKFSPLHWCLDAYYGLFLEGGKLKDVWPNVLSLILIIAGLQGIALWGLRRKKLI
ncbi:MAG TPA: ABC transporter permease [Puia sp.]|nr:ABC transporter permease [Puia sp.]